MEYTIELIDENKHVNLYSIRIDNGDLEFEKFLAKFPEDSPFNKEIEDIIAWIDKIIENGALERYFRPEGPFGTGAIPITKNRLRLYCYRVSDDILILGNGDAKDVKAWQDDPQLTYCAETIIELRKALLKAQNKGQTRIEGKYITGQLTLHIP